MHLLIALAHIKRFDVRWNNKREEMTIEVGLTIFPKCCFEFRQIETVRS